jgi:predicted  nucleic acid-binding Zn-ribbon protein
MSKDNVPVNSEVENLAQEVKELRTQLDEALKQTSGLTWNNRNWEAVKQNLEVNEQRINQIGTQIDSLKNLIMQVQTQFQQFQQQRAIELNNLLQNRRTDNNDDE